MISWWHLIIDEIILVCLLLFGNHYFISKKLMKAQKEIIDKIINHLAEGRKYAVEKVGHHVEGQLSELRRELKMALGDKVVAEKATVVAEKATVVAEEANQAKTDFLSRMPVLEMGSW